MDKKKSKTSKKVRFVFGRDMSMGGMVDAIVKMAEEQEINLVDHRKKHGIPPLVNSRKNDRRKRKSK